MSKLSKVQEAYARCKPARDALIEVGATCMEVTEDKAGIVWERWFVQTRTQDENGMPENRVINLIVFATPMWWDVFTPLEHAPEIDKVVAAIRSLPMRTAA